MSIIYLIGMPGCGKSTIGSIISGEINIKLIDLDEYIEEFTGKTIPALFKAGESHFRDMETQCLKLVSCMDNIIVATGGGIVERNENIAIMKNSGKVIFINTTPEQIMKNSSLDGRPLLAENKNRIFDLYDRRYEKYKNAADVIADNMGSIDDTVKYILKETTSEF